MQTNSIGCERDRLRRLLHGDIDARERSETLAHLDACEPCRLAIENLAAGKQWWDDVRRLGELPPSPTLAMDAGLPDDDAADFDSPSFLDPPRSPGQMGQFSGYEVIEVIGRGGMGIVLKAFDPTLHRIVAIKVLAPELAANVAARKRFVREARAAASVIHDHVVTIHAVAEARGLPYLVMAYIKGLSLQERIDRTGPMLATEILRIGMQTAQGLAAAHAQGLVHRDVKPSNILLENGIERVKLTDFGLARAMDDASVTQNGVVAGTPDYMSPEQSRGESVDHRADLFSLGSVLYAMCTGRPPFRAETTVGVLRRVSDDTPRPVREVNPEIPPWLSDTITRLHAKSPGDRFQSAAEVAEQLARHLACHQGSVPATQAVAAVRDEAVLPDRRGRRWTNWLRLAAAVFLLFGGLGASDAIGVTDVTGYLATVLRIPVQDGVLVVQVHEPGVRVEIDGKAISIQGVGVEEIRLHPGSYKVEATHDGVPILRQLVTVDRGGKRVVQVGLEGNQPVSTAVNSSGRKAGEPADRGSTSSKAGPRPKFQTPAEGCECSAVTFSPDGSRLAAAYANGTVIIWNATSGRRECTLEGPLQYASSVAFSPDGKSLASATGNWTRQEVDGLVDLWEVESGKHLARGEGHKGPVYCVAFAPDGRSAASGGADGTPRIWDAKDARCLNSLPKQADWIFSIAYAPDGQTIATGEQMSVRLLEPNTGKLKGVLEGHRGQVEAVAFSPDGRSIASGGRDRLIKLWDAASHRERVTLSGHAGWVTSLAFAANSLTLAAAGLNGDHSKEVRLWDTASARTIAILPDVNSHSVAVSPDEQTIATGNLSGSVQVWRIDEIVNVGK